MYIISKMFSVQIYLEEKEPPKRESAVLKKVNVFQRNNKLVFVCVPEIVHICCNSVMNKLLEF